MKVYTDASWPCKEGKWVYVVALAVTENCRLTARARLLIRPNEHPEVTGTNWAKRIFPGAKNYYTDARIFLKGGRVSRHAVHVSRKHEHIRECHTRAKRLRQEFGKGVNL